jgi:hypothetical protein
LPESSNETVPHQPPNKPKRDVFPIRATNRAILPVL